MSAFAAGSRTYTDPAGDGGAAPDLTTVVVSNADNGVVTFAITLANPALLTGAAYIQIYFNSDNNRSTGFDAPGSGSDYRVTLRPNISVFMRWNGSIFVEVRSTTFTRSGTTFTINRAELGGTSAFDFYLVSDAGATDFAPNGGVWSYALQITPPPPPPPPPAPDADGDGLRGAADKCPRTPAGRFDSNRNGCPGPYRVINSDPQNPGTASGGQTTFSRVVFRQLPPGAKVVIRAAGVKETVRASSAGSAPSKAMRRSFRDGSMVTVRITKPGYVGYHGQLRVGPPQGLKLITRRCIPATGRQAPVRCSRGLRGS